MGLDSVAILSLEAMYADTTRMRCVVEDQTALYNRACNSCNRALNKNDVCRGASESPKGLNQIDVTYM